MLTLFPLIWLVVFILAVIALVVIRPGHNVAWLVITILLIAVSVWIALPNNPGIHADFDGDGEEELSRRIDVRQGLDLAGGVRVLLQADVPEGTDLSSAQMSEVRRIVEQRIDALGALEPLVQLRGERRLIVELPGYSDPESAVDLIRETALLEFVDFGFSPPPEGAVIKTDYRQGSAVEEETPGDQSLEEIVYHTVMTGEILQSADVQFDPNTGAPLVGFVLTSEGSGEFAEYTREHSGQILGIVLDGEVISAPRIDEPITGGSGVITGQFTLEEATQLATQLRYGALPVPLRVESTSTVGPTLGQISVERSIQAGIIGIATVLLFMLIYYRLPGLAAALALITFALLNFALYKLIPITMTLPAITGFLISVGTAVDGNILIFERMKEELRKGKRLEPAVDAGFSRAWTSIRDSNLSTIIICAVLYAFGTSFGAGAVRGFAVTLALGLVINLFTAVTVTRTFLHFILLPVDEQFVANNRWLMGLPAKGTQNV